MKLYIISHYTWLSIAIFLLFFLNVAKYAINFSADDINPWNGFTGRMTSRVNLQENDRSFFNELMWQNPTITRETFQNQNVVHLGEGALELIGSAIEARNLRQEMEDHALILEVLQGKGAMGSVGLERPSVDKSYTDTGMNNIHHIKKFTNTGVDDLHHTKKINQLMYSVDQDFNLRHLHSVRVNMARSSSRRKSSSSSGMTGSSLRGDSKSSLGKEEVVKILMRKKRMILVVKTMLHQRGTCLIYTFLILCWKFSMGWLALLKVNLKRLQSNMGESSKQSVVRMRIEKYTVNFDRR